MHLARPDNGGGAPSLVRARFRWCCRRPPPAVGTGIITDVCEQRMSNDADAIERCWLASERRAAALMTQTVQNWRSFAESPTARGGSDYYQKLHDENPAYQSNNWLAEYASHLPISGTIVEIGTGNGAFARAIAKKASRVFAVDWAKSFKLAEMPSNVDFLQRDVLTDQIPPADLVCSADVLEHFSPDDLPNLLQRLTSASPHQFHVIACYDDGHSHQTVMPPSAWLALFHSVVADAELGLLHCRRNDPRQVVCAIASGSGCNAFLSAERFPAG